MALYEYDLEQSNQNEDYGFDEVGMVAGRRLNQFITAKVVFE